MSLITVDEALSRILSGVEPTNPIDVALLDAAGRTLAASLAAHLTQPPFDASAMDGYAVRSADVARLPARLHLIGQSRAGERCLQTLGPGQCVRIFTGAPVPAGADAIVIQENTDADGTTVIVRQGTPDPAHIRRRGGDFVAGEILLRPGVRLEARALTLAAAMGHASVPVRRKPVVALIATGDELVEPGHERRDDQIMSSNTYGLAALVAAAGGEALHLGIARDTRTALEAKFETAAEADVLVTTGGASVGDHDLVAPALAARGMTLDFWNIAMRPGKPMLFGHLGAQRVLGLPGNPVSALICGRVFLVPLIQALLGSAYAPTQLIRARLTEPLPANGPRRHYMRAMLDCSADGSKTVTPIASQDSSLMAPLAAADVLIIREIDSEALPAGTDIDVLPLDF